MTYESNIADTGNGTLAHLAANLLAVHGVSARSGSARRQPLRDLRPISPWVVGALPQDRDLDDLAGRVIHRARLGRDGVVAGGAAGDLPGAGDGRRRLQHPA